MEDQKKQETEKLLAIANEIADKAVKEILHELPPEHQGTAVTYIYTKMHDYYKESISVTERMHEENHSKYNQFREGDKIPEILKG